MKHPLHQGAEIMLDNLKRARALVAGMLEPLVILDDFFFEGYHGTQYDPMMLCCGDAHFQRLGMKRNQYGPHIVPDIIAPDNPQIQGHQHLDRIFGQGSFKILFAPYTSGGMDKMIFDQRGVNFVETRQLYLSRQPFERPISDKALALARFDMRIAQVESIVEMNAQYDREQKQRERLTRQQNAEERAAARKMKGKSLKEKVEHESRQREA